MAHRTPGVELGSRSRVDPAARFGSMRPTTRIKRHRGHRQGVGRGRKHKRNP
jgi:hypothetical protein